MNELHRESSPYLLQHANNPIHWKAWNEQSLATALQENKLIVVSIGYSACHWCHVMEHESFEDEEVAAVMNKSYISIKVDREERPDVDAIYMKAVQLLTGRGGWPMNAVLLPDGRPVWGGTYFRKNNWIDALEQLQELFVRDPKKMEEHAEKIMAGVRSIGLFEPNTEQLPDPSQLNEVVAHWATMFDHEYGGYQRAPKFMMPGDFQFLQRYGYQTNSKEILDFVDLTLTRMAWGGLFDTLGGGFSRYSVDARWHVPHFEKMLYDNGQLMSLYAEAYKRTGKLLYKEVIEKTHYFIQTELTLTNGAFYSALDADSINQTGKLEEGAFYVWEKNDLATLLQEDFDLFSKVYNINSFGFWENGHYVLIRNRDLEEIALEEELTIQDLLIKKKQWEQLLYNEREQRPKPRLDDKTLTSWNALMLKGYVDAYTAIGNEEYLEAAHRNALFITGTMWHDDGHLWRTYKEGMTKIKGFLEDYALTADAFISFYQATLEEKWLIYAKQLTDYCLEHFYDDEKQLFRYNSLHEEQLVAPHYETEDNVIPASNSVIANVLYKLSIMFNNSYYEKIALQMLNNVIPNLDYPSAFSNWLRLWLSLSEQNRELAITGENAVEVIKTINKKYLPNVIIAGSTTKSEIPFLQGRFVKDKTTFYVCRDKTCNLPATSIEETLKDLIIN